MPSTAIRVHNLGKQYQLGARKERYRTVRDALTEGASRIWRSSRALLQGNRRRGRGGESFWALRDVSFEVESGEVIGLIGRNGAGKSTLLKVLSQITEPTAGYADLYGRVGALLEVGTGFHPELSGRENVFLNGAILGMKRAEIRRHFDAIVAFAEIEQFIDTPAKRYSTGMYMRLAFAVAAHLQPDILLVDEVLAVGDAAFQKKCIGKMGEVAKQGRTVVFVSHNMAAVRTLCTRGIVLDRGAVSYEGDIERAIYQYFESLAAPSAATSDGPVSFTEVRIGGRPTGSIQSCDAFTASCRFSLQAPLPSFRILCAIQSVNGDALAVAPLHHHEFRHLNEEGVHELHASFPPLWLRPGVYSLHFRLQANDLNSGKSTYISDSVMLDVSGDVPPEMLYGALTPRVEWAAPRVKSCSAIDSDSPHAGAATPR
jgi:lipopolysaccharide transport system ATP-binding protein